MKLLLSVYNNVKDYNKKFRRGIKLYEYENEFNDILGNDFIISFIFIFLFDVFMVSFVEKRKLNESDDSDDIWISE